MARKLNPGGAFGGAVGGDASAPPTGQTLPGGAQAAPTLGKKQQNKITKGVHGDPNNPFNTNISGNITSGQGSFVANENPDDYWTWLMGKAGLNQDPKSSFGKFLADQNTYMQQLYGAAKQDNPNLYYSNFLGSYGYGSPTQADPAADKSGLGGSGGGNHRNRNNNQQSNNNGPDHKRRNKGGRSGGKGSQSQPSSPPPRGGQ